MGPAGRGRAPAPERRRGARVRSRLGAPEASKGGVLQIPSRHTFDALVAALHQASKRKDLKGVFVAFGAAPLGWARAHELGDALAALKSAKVPVLCHADAWENATYAAAARGCDTIAMSPGGEVEATGPAATVPYARELLVDKLKAQVDILQVGKFKGAAEPLTRDGPSEEYRQSIEGALGAITRSYKEALEVRGVADLAGTGPWVGEEAKNKKLVDLLVDRKAARAEIKKRARDAPVQTAFGAGAEAPPKLALVDVIRLLSQPTGEATARPHVRLVRLHGEISLGGEGGGLLGRPTGIVARRVVERAHALAEDARVRAAVLRIDSPGGSALGSDLAWIALKELRDKKPVIVSVGEMAASGGYYLASAGTRIFAEPESIVGSIGVVGGKIAFGGTLAQLGVHTATFGDPRAAKMASLTEPWDDATRARLLETMKGIYDLFLKRIADGRGRAVDSFDPAVEGRVFGGDRAKELGLVDEIGGLGHALAHAKKAANLDETSPVVVDDATSFFEILAPDDDEVLAPLGAAATPELRALHHWLRAFARATSEAHPAHVATMLPVPLLVR
ncbi:MAG: S49 family peptidase [Deltaproteobacteria bacterium]|nr:S49 family peptidase [Deltaproteobacteria bacterium]